MMSINDHICLRLNGILFSTPLILAGLSNIMISFSLWTPELFSQGNSATSAGTANGALQGIPTLNSRDV